MSTASPFSSWAMINRLLFIGGAVTLVLTLVSIRWIDLPLASWIHAHGLDSRLWMRWFLDTPIVATPVAMIYMLIYIVRRKRSAATRGEDDWFLVSAALLVSLEVKYVLKLAFGRTWPREVMNVGAPKSASFDCVASHGYLNDGIHLFNFFQGADKQYSAFPSGSTVSLIAMVVPIMALYPRFRWPLVAFSAVSLLFFVLTNTHYLGDVVAGLYVGLLCGLVPLAMRADRLAGRV
ncbi:phosphatase PAP2 family protein [Luteibacter aegosomatis]|uniref:phosphatase PAP2 family protein n=1 Tax=Luteibacter aegosomatis TaxID=2911537 RepID=UPI001FF99A70|nr:phosphatase PAP2 family protein [Luteibacter aegosomatis]UPG85815.1 phosphatase PAP2 family protein [Luteibacter aegosomatis]